MATEAMVPAMQSLLQSLPWTVPFALAAQCSVAQSCRSPGSPWPAAP